MTLIQTIEAILLASSKPVSKKKLALLTGSRVGEVQQALETLAAEYDPGKRGIVLVLFNDKAQLTTHPECAELIREYLKEDISGDLTRPALETLSVIAYRGPLSKQSIEEIRGVNCSLALRNLFMRGLIETKDSGTTGEKSYSLSFDFMRQLGVATINELPEYERLRTIVYQASEK